jgi:hypothetical protein
MTYLKTELIGNIEYELLRSLLVFVMRFGSLRSSPRGRRLARFIKGNNGTQYIGSNVNLVTDEVVGSSRFGAVLMQRHT